MLSDPRAGLKSVMEMAEQALQKATAELQSLPDDSPLIITTARKMHQASATYLTSTVALLTYDSVELKREMEFLWKRVAALEETQRRGRAEQDSTPSA
jgi:hypothetical protein